MVKKIILVFKTHFDIGFTDLSKNVIDQYGDRMLRQVIETCRATEHMGKLHYVWTMPAWPLWKICQSCAPELRPELDRLIEEGQIVWHGLPFTSHTDFASPEEYAEGFRFSKELAERYGKPLPKAAKMTDVPGHGRMLPELLSQAGIRFLHLGCNEFATPPQVPELFLWEGPGGGQVLTMYSKGGYGTSLLPPENWPFSAWMALMHTHDNCGPQSAEMIAHMVATVREKYPEAEVVCGTMDDFWEAMAQEDLSGLPVVRTDLADTWIHGVGSYPAEIALVRENRLRARRLHSRSLSRLLAGEELPELWEHWKNYYEQVALFEEHTWGADVKTWLGPDRVYEKEAFQQARTTERYRFMEASWQEQRDRANRASAILDTIEDLLPPPEPKEKPKDACRSGRNGERMWVENDRYRLTFLPDTGVVLNVYDRVLGDTLLRKNGDRGVFAYRYERLGMEDMTQFLRTYGYHFLPWGIQDYGRENYPYCDRKVYDPIYDGYELSGDTLTLRYHTDESARRYGDARRIRLDIAFAGDELRLTLRLEDKQATPYLEAGSFLMPLGWKGAYRIAKPGAAVDPRRDIQPCCNQALYNMEQGVQAENGSTGVQIASPDAALFALGSSGVYEYYPVFPEQKEPELWFNLFNNMWGTNFPQWIEGDLCYHFTLRGVDPAGAGSLQSWTAAENREEIASWDLPKDMDVVRVSDEADGLYVTIRSWTGKRRETLHLPGWKLGLVDLLHRPLGAMEKEDLTLDWPEQGLRVIRLERL